MNSSKACIDLEDKFNAKNYHPVPVVFSRARGARVWDPEGKEYLDFLSAYSAVNQGHCHPRLVTALTQQAEKLSLSCRAFYNDQLGVYSKFICQYFAFDRVLPVNTGVEAVETALKLARKWAYVKKGVAQDEAIILAVENNFHGRTLAVISMSSDPSAKAGFGPFLPNVGHQCVKTEKKIRYNQVQDLEEALKVHGPKVAGFLVEPIQGEAGVILPEPGYLKECFDLCKKHNVLFMADEIQSGLGRSGKLLACDYDAVKPDILILGKALAGGMYPVSAVLASDDVMLCIKPGEHGSTFGGNPLGCAVAMEALKVLEEERMIENSFECGALLRSLLTEGLAGVSAIKDIRGRGLMNAIEFDPTKLPIGKSAFDLCTMLAEKGILSKPTHENIVRLTPPLMIKEEDIRKAASILVSSIKEFLK